MNWDEKTTEQYLKKNKIKYYKYKTVLGDYILDYDYCPYVSMLRYGQVNDTCIPDRTKPEKIKKLVYVQGNELIVYEPPVAEESHLYLHVSRDGLEGDCQVGGTLESFLRYLNAWASMDRTSDPFVSPL